jgi:outer membrane PBP1 activator LpoA protein
MIKKIASLLLAASLVGCATHGSIGKTSPVASQPIDVNVSTPTRVALLLPLDGPLKNYSSAIQTGFFAASKNSGFSAPSISVINTSGSNAVAAYDKAVTGGANFIVGPLSKPEVSALANHGDLKVPTLALNTLDKSQKISNLYQFGLSPFDEAYQAADKAHQDQHQNVLIIAPNSAWGKSVVRVFMNRWNALGGKVAGQTYYTDQQTLMKDVSNLLQVKEPVKTKGDHSTAARLRLVPTHRQDADVIFMVATPYYARQIRPMLKYYFAGNIPVYATSQIYSGTLHPNKDQDLDGVMFCDTPAPNTKLYSLGFDAYNVMMHLNQMAAHPQVGLPGQTGTLFLGQNLHIYRQLMWYRMSNGQPVRIG